MEETHTASLIHHFFSPTVCAQIEEGLPRLEKWSSDLLVPCELRQLAAARLVWINIRWFLERQIDLDDVEVRNCVERWLIAEFGYSVPRTGDPDGAFRDQTRTLYADRYGSVSGMSPHGGSGRAVVSGCFQAKGVGTTPLVGSGAHAGHSHGCSSLEECVREAIYAEVCEAEFPHGAIPVVAILDTGLTFSSPDAAEVYDQDARRGIAIRPATIRAAHAERAPLFKISASGFVNIQAIDVRRTRDVVRHWVQAAKSVSADRPAIQVFFERVAEQVAFGQVHRLFNGGYFSSNLSLSGALLDFGNMHALRNWVNASVLSNTPGFGDEWLVVRRMISSLSFYVRKYGDESAAVPEEDLVRTYQRTHSESFARECLRIWMLEDEAGSRVANQIVDLLHRYFNSQQKRKVTLRFGIIVANPTPIDASAWLYDDLFSSMQFPSIEADLIRALDSALRHYFGKSSEGRRRIRASYATADRYLRPRESLNRATLLERVRQVIRSGRDLYCESIDRLIWEAIDAGRRLWRRLPPNLVVYGHVTRAGSSALICSRISDGKQFIWIEGIKIGDDVRFFDQCLKPADFRCLPFQSEHGRYWSITVPHEHGYQKIKRGTMLRLGKRFLRLPGFSVFYSENCPANTLRRYAERIG